MSLTVHHDPDLDCVTLQLGERFDFSVHRAFHDACLDGRAARSYVIDLGEVSSMDSSALGMLLLLRDHAGGDSSEIRVINSNPDVLKIFNISNFDKLFDIT